MNRSTGRGPVGQRLDRGMREGEKVGLPCRANAVLTHLVKRVEEGELKVDPATSPSCG